MIIGEYPCCGGDLWLTDEPERTPAFMPEDCPHCGAKVWHRFSRFDPWTRTEADFIAEYIVDEATKKVSRR